MLIAACGQPATPARVVSSSVVTSNVMRADYAGSKRCADCHGAIYSAWEASPMRNMTRDATSAHIEAPFDGAQLHIGTDVVTMTTDNGHRVMTIDSPAGSSRWRITKVVGGRYREDFVGVQDGDPTEHVLAATFVFSNRTWRYKGYSVMVKERPRASVAGVWSQECIGCHNTLPLATMLYDDLYGPKLPAYQGKMSDRTLPRSRTWTASARDKDGLAHAIADEIRFLGGTPPESLALDDVLPEAARTSEAKLDGAHLVELGVGCEACHNGSKAHAVDPNLKPSFAATSPLLGVAPPRGEDGTRAQWINHTCAKCHTVLFTHYPWTWEGGKRRDADPGGSTTTSGEGRDYQLGGCSSQMACTSCHDPHTMDAPDKLRDLATKSGDKICASCHAKVAEHSHHTSVGCIGCHMPKKNMGLDYVLDRYHRIGSPSDARRVLGDRPVECALCHADKTVEQLVGQMETWWGKHYDRDALRKLYGPDLAVNALRATLQLGKPHEQAVAISVLGDAKDKTAIEAIVPMLAHDYPLVRYFAQRALQQITGDPVAIDVGAPAADVRRQADSWSARFH